MNMKLKTIFFLLAPWIGAFVVMVIVVLLVNAAEAAPFSCGTKAKWLLSDSAYSQAVATHCEGYLTAQVECKAHKTWVQGSNNYDYSGFNTVKSFADAHGLVPRCHALIWLEQQPDWFSGLSNSQLREKAMGAIDAAVANGARHLEIVNEPERGLGVFEKLGPNFIGDLYRHARQQCPSCPLAINFLNPPPLSYIQAIDYPVDIVGVEGHIGNSVPDWSDWIKRVKGLGYRVFITEFDTPSATREPAESFAKMTKSAGVDAFIVWNITNMPDDSWQRGAPLNYPSMTPNPMYDGLVAGLSGQGGSDGSSGQGRTGRRGGTPDFGPPQCFSLFGIQFCF